MRPGANARLVTTQQVVSVQVSRAAVLDLGSTSFQLMVCQTGPSRRLKPVLKRQSLLNLGLEVGSRGVISPGRVRAAMAAVKALRRVLDRASPDVVVPLATAALRDAANGPQVVERLEHVLGAPIRVLQGAQEARLCFVGQRAGVYVGEAPTLGIDLGGGSFEMAVGNCYEIYVATSAPVGPTRLKGELGTGELLGREDRKEVRERVREAIEAMAPGLDDYPRVAARTVISGGTARALARLAMARARGRPGASGWGVNQVELSLPQLADLAGMLSGLDLAHRLALPGMPARRAAMLPLGACILLAIAEELGIDHYVVSEWGLREGAMLDALYGAGGIGWRQNEDLFVAL
jgi:exopolyphosphatase / guanosine-5'-triphosphate,3'-diphosphate pyrophosphatase